MIVPAAAHTLAGIEVADARPVAGRVTVEVGANAPADWDTYVCAHADASAYHLSAAVNVGATTFGLRTFFLHARDAESRLVGVLPLVEQSSLLFGRFLISVPFFTYGGMLADGAEAASALVAQAAQLAREHRARHVELRHSAPVPGVSLPERLDKVSMVLALPASEEALRKQLGSKLRSQIKRADREQIEVVWGGEECLSGFYPVFASTMHALGTPVYPRRFFENFCRALGSRVGVLLVKAHGEVQAASIVIRHGERIEVPWAAATPEAKRNAVNMRLYWEMLLYAVQSGASSFDFGRSTVDAGTYRFKAQWGAQPVQLHWHYWLPDAAPIPQLNHSNPKYALAADLWRRMPLWCANLIGPRIARSLP